MPVTILEKLAFGLAALVLFALGRTTVPVALAGSIDMALAVGFAVALARTPKGAD